MDDFGKTLHFIRTSKQVSINKLADDVISKSQLELMEEVRKLRQEKAELERKMIS